MSYLTQFSKAKHLGFFIENIGELPGHSWLYIATSMSEVSADTMCFPTVTDSRDMTDEEYELFETGAAQAGLKCFLQRVQIEDVLTNLLAQGARFTTEDFALAINYYWRNDAFIKLPKEG